MVAETSAQKPLSTSSNPKQMSPTGLQRLELRGIDSASARFGWENNDRLKRWFYPVIDPLTGSHSVRSKAYDSANGAKYLWQSTNGKAAAKPQGLNYYAPQGSESLRAAIASQQGELLIVNGEPAVLVALIAGRDNVLSWFGESSVPKSLVSDLHTLKVQRIRFIADKDAAGLKAAAKVRTLLKGSGIEFIAVALPEVLPEKADLNDLWMDLYFNPELFWITLDACSVLELPEPTSTTFNQTFRHAVPKDNTPTWDEFYAQLDATVERTFDIKSYKNTGWSNIFVNHWREEKHASANYNRKIHVLKDFGDDTVYKPRELAECLGIVYPAWSTCQARHMERSTPGNAVPTVEDILASGEMWWKTIPEVVWEILREGLPGQSAKRLEKVLSLLNLTLNKSLVSCEALTVKSLSTAAEQLNIPLSLSTIGRGLEELAFESLFLSKVETSTSLVPGFDKKSKKGRPAVVYQVLTKETVIGGLLQVARRYLAEKHLGQNTLTRFTPEMLSALVDEEASVIADTLAEVIEPSLEKQAPQRKRALQQYNADLKRLTLGLDSPSLLELEPLWAAVNPRAAKARAILRGTPNKAISLKVWARELGCAESYVSTVLAAAGIKGTQNYGEFPLQSVSDLSGEIRHISYQHRCRVLSLKVMEGGCVVASRLPYDCDSQWVQEQQRQGQQVFAYVQMTNTYEIVCDEPASKPQRVSVEHHGRSSGVIKSKTAHLKLEHDYREGHNPRWVFGQLVLALELGTGYEHRSMEGTTLFIDSTTGEVMCRAENYRDLLKLINELLPLALKDREVVGISG